jgi:hypothetical protein
MVGTVTPAFTRSARHSGISGTKTTLPARATARQKRVSAGCDRPLWVSPCSTTQPGSRMSRPTGRYTVAGSRSAPRE